MDQPVPANLAPPVPPPQPPRASSIDHVGFPHIVDAVLAAAVSSPTVSLALRATSRQFQARVDPVLFHHLIVTKNPCPGGRPVLAGPHGRLPGLRWEDANASAAERALWVQRLAHARVLDYYDTVDIATDDPELAIALARVRVVRRIEPNAKHVLPAPKIVDFVYLTPTEGFHTHADSSIGSPCSCPSAFTTDAPDTTAKTVINVLYHPERLPLHSFLQLGRVPEKSQTVIIYTELAGSASGSASGDDTESDNNSDSSGDSESFPGATTSLAPTPRFPMPLSRRNSAPPSPTPTVPCTHLAHPQLGMLWHLVDELGFRVPTSHHTLVGIESIDRALLGLPQDTTNDDLRRIVLEAIQQECSIYVPEAVAAQVPSAITFMTHDEYRAQLTDEDEYEREYELETRA